MPLKLSKSISKEADGLLVSAVHLYVCCLKKEKHKNPRGPSVLLSPSHLPMNKISPCETSPTITMPSLAAVKV